MRTVVSPSRDLVLVGGGHAHLEVLRSWPGTPGPGLRLSVVVIDPRSVYSGMVPGVIAGRYAPSDLAIDVRPLAARVGARLVVARATGIDAGAQRIELAGAAPLPFDVASLDVGSEAGGAEIPGVARHALAARPLDRLLHGLDATLVRARVARRFRVAVVGGGAGGMEIAFAVRARLAREGLAGAGVILVEAAPRLLPALHERVGRRVERAARARGIELRLGAAVASIDEKSVTLTSGATLECDTAIWAAGASGPDWLAASRLPTDRAGFVRVGPTLQVEGRRELFAAGDCAAFDPPLPKAGVHAVRQGPVLARNLRAALDGRPLESYRPRRDALALLNLGDGRALGTKWGVTFEGHLGFALKDWIDRRYMRRMRTA
jgi:selenide,water dikinase